VTADEKRLQTRRHARIRRVKQVLKWLPRRANLNRYPVLKWFAKAARKRPYLWSFKVPSCTPAFYFGSIIAFLPIMGAQILLAFLAALFTRANLPVIVGLQAISNPFTFPFIVWMNYLVGRRIMNFLSLGTELNPNWEKLNATFLGGAIIGLVVGVILDLLYRFMLFETRRHSKRRAPGASPLPAEATLPLPEPARQDIDTPLAAPEEETDEVIR
jgi:uncharacterized protein